MSYRIEYPLKKNHCGSKKRHNQKWILTTVCFLLFVFLVNISWSRGREVLQRLIFSGDIAVTASALEELSADLRANQSLYTALHNFCSRIIGEIAIG